MAQALIENVHELVYISPLLILFRVEAPQDDGKNPCVLISLSTTCARRMECHFSIFL